MIARVLRALARVYLHCAGSAYPSHQWWPRRFVAPLRAWLQVTGSFVRWQVTGTELCAVHFYHKSMESCKIMDMHLRRLAPKLFTCKFMSMNVEKAPFFVDKLRIRVMPTLVMFKDGVAVHHMIGFDEVGGKNEFRTVDLARVIYLHEAPGNDTFYQTCVDWSSIVRTLVAHLRYSARTIVCSQRSDFRTRSDLYVPPFSFK